MVVPTGLRRSQVRTPKLAGNDYGHSVIPSSKPMWKPRLWCSRGFGGRDECKPSTSDLQIRTCSFTCPALLGPRYDDHRWEFVWLFAIPKEETKTKQIQIYICIYNLWQCYKWASSTKLKSTFYKPYNPHKNSFCCTLFARMPPQCLHWA